MTPPAVPKVFRRGQVWHEAFLGRMRCVRVGRENAVFEAHGLTRFLSGRFLRERLDCGAIALVSDAGEKGGAR